MKINIDDFLARLFTPIEATFSIKSSRDWLDALHHELNNYQRNLQEKIANFGGMKILEDIERKWRDTEQIIDDIEQKASIPLLNQKNSQIQAEAKTCLRQVSDLIKHNFDLTVHQETLGIVSELQKYLQGRTTQVTAFSNLVETLQNTYEKQEKDLRQLNFDEMSGEAIFDMEDIDRCFQNMLPEDDFRSQLVLASAAITEPYGRGESLANFIDRERTTPNQLQKEIDIKVDSLFAPRSVNIVNSVIKRFMQNYSLSARSTRLTQIMQEAEPLLHLKLRDPYFSHDKRNSSKLVGFKDTDEVEIQQFKTLLSQDLGIDNNVFKPTQSDDEILILNEYAGFPLRIISSLERMRNHYLREQNSATSFLHNDYQSTFADIIPPDAKIIEELEDIFYPCLAFKLLAESPDNNKLEFQYYDALRDNYNIASLSSEWSQALEELAHRKDMKQALQKILDDEIIKIEEQTELWENEYLPKLRQFVKEVDNLPEDNPNFSYKETVVGSSNSSTEFTTKEGIINRFLRQINERFKLLPRGSFSPIQDTFQAEATPGEIIVKSSVDSSNNRYQRRLELETLQQDLAKGFITEEEYERERKQIFLKYPL